jgi:hypothetical protein
VELYSDTNSERNGTIFNAVYFPSAINATNLKAWDTVTHFLRNDNQLTVVLDNLKPAGSYRVRAVIFENNGQHTTHRLKETLFKTLPCVVRGM